LNSFPITSRSSSQGSIEYPVEYDSNVKVFNGKNCGEFSQARSSICVSEPSKLPKAPSGSHFHLIVSGDMSFEALDIGQISNFVEITGEFSYFSERPVISIKSLSSTFETVSLKDIFITNIDGSLITEN
jgi:hypothetical protein